jgi:hypothetical protein
MKRSLLLLAILTVAVAAFGQKNSLVTINAVGGQSVINSNTYEWSIGELVLVNTFSSSSLVVTQGVLQPFQKDNSVDPANNYLAANLKLYPVPADAVLYLQPNFSAGSKLNYTVQDATGKQLMKQEVQLGTGIERQMINMSAFISATYIVTVQLTEQGKTYLQSFKVEKIK